MSSFCMLATSLTAYTQCAKKAFHLRVQSGMMMVQVSVAILKTQNGLGVVNARTVRAVQGTICKFWLVLLIFLPMELGTVSWNLLPLC